jgi:DNA-binding MarR family transcriptional regulator
MAKILPLKPDQAAHIFLVLVALASQNKKTPFNMKELQEVTELDNKMFKGVIPLLVRRGFIVRRPGPLAKAVYYKPTTVATKFVRAWNTIYG